ncbi:MAG: hypothetical protein U1E83_07645 [Methylotetracoccus sp.]
MFEPTRTHFLAPLLAGCCIASTTLLAAEDHLRLKSVEAEWEAHDGTKSLDVELKTKVPIPANGRSGAFGYAILTDQGNNALVLVTHLPIDDSSYERVPSGFHTHVLDLKAPGPACQGASFEVDLENSGKNRAFDANYRWSIDDNKARIEDVPIADLGDAGVEAVASFVLKPVLGADGKPTNLCVTVIDQI